LQPRTRRKRYSGLFRVEMKFGCIVRYRLQRQNEKDDTIPHLKRRALAKESFGRVTDFYRLMLSGKPVILSRNPVYSQGRLVTAANLRIFVFVRNHPPAFFDSSEDIVVGFLMRDFEP
jgi:hypothetical protein